MTLPPLTPRKALQAVKWSYLVSVLDAFKFLKGKHLVALQIYPRLRGLWVLYLNFDAGNSC